MKIGKNINYSNQAILLAVRLGYSRIIGYADGGRFNAENVLIFRKSRNEWLAVLQSGDGFGEQSAIKFAKCSRDFQNHTLESAIEFIKENGSDCFVTKEDVEKWRIESWQRTQEEYHQARLAVKAELKAERAMYTDEEWEAKRREKFPDDLSDVIHANILTRYNNDI